MSKQWNNTFRYYHLILIGVLLKDINLYPTSQHHLWIYCIDPQPLDNWFQRTAFFANPSVSLLPTYLLSDHLVIEMSLFTSVLKEWLALPCFFLFLYFVRTALRAALAKYPKQSKIFYILRATVFLAISCVKMKEDVTHDPQSTGPKKVFKTPFYRLLGIIRRIPLREKESVFRVFLAPIFPHSDWIRQ